MTSEELMRKDEELQDCKSDIINKLMMCRIAVCFLHNNNRKKKYPFKNKFNPCIFII